LYLIHGFTAFSPYRAISGAARDLAAPPRCQGENGLAGEHSGNADSGQCLLALFSGGAVDFADGSGTHSPAGLATADGLAGVPQRVGDVAHLCHARRFIHRPDSPPANPHHHGGARPTPRATAPEVLPALPQPTHYRYVVVEWGPITVTRRSLDLGIRIGTLLFTLIYGTNLYLLTTAPEEITLALEALMKPLRWIGLPVTEIALTVTLSLRFIPLVLEEVQNLVRSVQTRAINWKKLGLRGSTQVWLMVTERLLENLLLRAEQTAAAMEVRGFTSPNEHQVRWHQLVLRRWDWFALGLVVLLWWARLGWGGDT
jgi:hypothetical protein